MGKIEFKRSVGALTVMADELGLLVDCGWTLVIPKNRCVDYVRNYNSFESGNEGFLISGESVMFSHGAGKIMLSIPEADAIVDLIKIQYM